MAALGRIPYRCSVCSMEFDDRRSLSSHRSRVHRLPVASRSISCGEEGCSQTFLTVVQLRRHLSAKHNFSFNEEHLTFNTDEEFTVWKEQLEARENLSFVQINGEKRSENKSVTYWYCKRSRIRVAHTQGQRQRKSWKIGCYCTANLVARRDESGKIYASVCSTHYGHNHQPQQQQQQQQQQQFLHQQLHGGPSSASSSSGQATRDAAQEVIAPMLAAEDLPQMKLSLQAALTRVSHHTMVCDDASALVQARMLVTQAWRVLARTDDDDLDVLQLHSHQHQQSLRCKQVGTVSVAGCGTSGGGGTRSGGSSDVIKNHAQLRGLADPTRTPAFPTAIVGAIYSHSPLAYLS